MEISTVERCPWGNHATMAKYHDEEWGQPIHDDRLLFEFLILEGAQAGLSWSTILKKRETYRAAFDQFDIATVANYDEQKIEELLVNPGIIRNQAKIRGTIQNARVMQKIQQEYTSLDTYFWSFIGGKPKVNTWQEQQEVPTRSHESDMLSKDLKRRGGTFVGTTICYAFMQAIGIVNDHIVSCFRYRELLSENS
jgi:DNA-3-methyladenine glycosylase I